MRWRKSADNPESTRRPLEGDIAIRCKRELGVVGVAESALRKWDDGVRPEPPKAPRPELTPEEMEARRKAIAQITEEAGYGNRAPRDQSAAQTQRNINEAKGEQS